MNETRKDNIPRAASAPSIGEVDPFERQKQTWQSQPFPAAVLHAVPMIVIVFNARRQIVFANEVFLGRVKAHDVEGIGPRRWGDVLECQHAFEEGGCGATPFCRTCGGLTAIEAALGGTRDVQECRILSRSGAALDLQVTAVPIEIGSGRYAICTLADIGAQKRRRALERLFFHDVLNSAVGVRGLADLLKEAEGEKAAEIRDMIVGAAATLTDQIQSPRLLTMAENKELPVSFRQIDSLDFLQGVFANWQEKAKTRRLTLRLNDDSAPVQFSSDETILSHVLNSMVKNAFEASSRGTEITLGCDTEDQAVTLRVRNEAVMTENVQHQVFQRSFSTRGSGRGLGTYSMKLLTEQYLGGKAGFRSEKDNGTTFYVRLPLTPVENTGAAWNGA